MRSVSQIYSEAIATRNNYLQLTELNSGRTNSKMSIMNLMTYVVAVCIYTSAFRALEAFLPHRHAGSVTHDAEDRKSVV